MVPAVLAVVIYAGPTWFLIALGSLGTLCLREYCGLARAMGLRAQPWFCYAAFWILIAAFHEKWLPPAGVLAAILLAGFLAAILRRDELRERALGLMANLLGVLYLALFLGPAYQVRFEFGDLPGLNWFLMLLAVIWVGDTAALFVGKTMGRTPFAPLISPNKTNEGAAGGLVAGVAAAVLLQQLLFRDLPLRHAVAASIVLGIFGQIGDLAESLLKRAAQVKDSSGLIPGHGGVLDRVDSLLFAFPVLYFYMLCLYPR